MTVRKLRCSPRTGATPGDISLVSGLRSECLSSSIGSSRALCSLHTAAYQQHACAPLSRRLPRLLPVGGGLRAGERGFGNAARTGHFHVLLCCLFYRVSSASCRQREARLRGDQLDGNSYFVNVVIVVRPAELTASCVPLHHLRV